MARRLDSDSAKRYPLKRLWREAGRALIGNWFDWLMIELMVIGSNIWWKIYMIGKLIIWHTDWYDWLMADMIDKWLTWLGYD